MTQNRQGIRDALTMVGVLTLVLIALPIAAVLGVFLRLPLLVAVVLAVAVMAVVAFFSPAFREWLNVEIDQEYRSNGMRLAPDVAVSSNHTWVRPARDESWVGVDDLVQATLGPVDRLGLPPEGLHVERGEPLFTLHRGDRALVVRSPLSGLVSGRNARLEREPRLVNREPFTGGWAVRIRGDDTTWDESRSLLRGRAARSWFRSEVDRLLTAVSPPTPVGATLPDGGVFNADLWSRIDDEAWDRLTREFFTEVQGAASD